MHICQHMTDRSHVGFCVYRDVLERNRIKESFVRYAQFRNDSECQKAQRHDRVHIVGNAELFVRRLYEVNFFDEPLLSTLRLS